MKKIYSTIVLMAMMVASLGMVSCGSDDDNSNGPIAGPTEAVTYYADTISVKVNIPADLKEMFKLHYYTVEDGVEKEVDAIPASKKIYNQPGSHSYGYKIGTEIVKGSTMDDDAFSAYIRGIAQDYAKNNNINYATYKFNHDIYSICRNTFDEKSITVATPIAVADYMTQYKKTAEEAYLDVAEAFFNYYVTVHPSFAFNFKVSSDKQDGSRSTYVWKNY